MPLTAIDLEWLGALLRFGLRMAVTGFAVVSLQPRQNKKKENKEQ